MLLTGLCPVSCSAARLYCSGPPVQRCYATIWPGPTRINRQKLSYRKKIVLQTCLQAILWKHFLKRFLFPTNSSCAKLTKKKKITLSGTKTEAINKHLLFSNLRRIYNVTCLFFCLQTIWLIHPVFRSTMLVHDNIWQHRQDAKS